ncbi:MAG: hypothetical protein GOVbin1782_110 [Prokaryotic dsDNA virus sp.]|nr:MAG: hypothetical protein GOVbin1782_110 [Prokaryotic dsDNA virus sp.]
MTTGFHWTYGVVQQQASTGGGGASPPTVGIAATNLGDALSISPSFGVGAGQPTVDSVPQGFTIGSGQGEHTVQVNTTFSAGSGTITSAFLTIEEAHAGLGNLEFAANPNAAANAVIFRSGRDALGWMGNSDILQLLIGVAGNDVVYAGITNPNTTIDVVASNTAASGAGSAQNVFYFNFQNRAQTTAGISTAGGFNANHIASGTLLRFNLTVTNSNGLSNNATSTITIT